MIEKSVFIKVLRVMSHASYRFTHAICRLPSRSLIDGLRAEDIGQPDYHLFVNDHKHYIQALESTGAEVIVLDALEEFPDSVFVEDAVLCLPKGAVIMRPGAPSRLGEAEAIKQTITSLYTNVEQIKGPGFIEGGDVLVTQTEVLVGRSARTDKAGIEELMSIIKPWGYKLREVDTPQGVLHFKTDCSLLDENTILSTKRLAQSGCFEGYEVINTADGEEACANTVRFNDYVLMPDGFPETEKKLLNYGYKIKRIGNTQAAKLDGGMSCLSLRFTPS